MARNAIAPSPVQLATYYMGLDRNDSSEAFHRTVDDLKRKEIREKTCYALEQKPKTVVIIEKRCEISNQYALSSGTFVHVSIAIIGCSLGILNGVSSPLVLMVAFMVALCSIGVGAWCWLNDSSRAHALENVQLQLVEELKEDNDVLRRVKDILSRVEISDSGRISNVMHRFVMFLGALCLLSILGIAVSGAGAQTQAIITGMVLLTICFGLSAWQYYTIKQIPAQNQFEKELLDLADELKQE